MPLFLSTLNPPLSTSHPAMLYQIQVHWSARVPHPDYPLYGTTTYAEFARSYNAAASKAKMKFRRHYGAYRAISHTSEVADPAGVYTPPRIDCGSGRDFGICPVCGKGHGHVVMRDGKLTPYFARMATSISQ